jgi:copper chaperone CopZ
VRVAVRNLPGVDSVRVSLNEGYADVRFEPGSTVTVEQVREAIRKNGFTPREAQVRVRGRVTARGGDLVLEAPGAGSYVLTGAAELLARLQPADPVVRTLEGVVAERPSTAIRVTGVVPDG